jgi:hypothetical protein
VVLFSSPSTARWRCHYKDQDTKVIGLGMELWTSEELRKYDPQKKYPRRLCEKNAKCESLVNDTLKDLGCKKEAADIYRRDLFGKQARFEFSTNEEQIVINVNLLKTAIENIVGGSDFSGLRIANSITTESKIANIQSHKIKQLQYNVNDRTFSERFMSHMVIKFLSFKLEKVREDRYREFLGIIKETRRETYGHFFESYVRDFLLYGFCGDVKNLLTNERRDFKFDWIDFKKDFVYKTYNRTLRFQILLQKENTLLRLLGADGFNNSVLLSPTKTQCATFDDIMIIPSGRIGIPTHISFVQTTTRNNHPIKLSGILGMLLLAMLVELRSGVAPQVSFLFVVPSDLIRIYTESESQTEDLIKVFENISIFAVTINDDTDQIPNFYNDKDTQIPSSFNDTFKRDKYLLAPGYQNPSQTTNVPQINLFRLFSKWDANPSKVLFSFLDPKFHVINEEKTWDRIKFSTFEDKIILRVNEKKKNQPKKKKKKKKSVNVKKENGAKKNSEKDSFEDLYYQFLGVINKGYVEPKRRLVFSKSFTKLFICKVVYCLMFKIVHIELFKETKEKYYLKFYVSDEMTLNTINSSWEQMRDFLRIFENVEDFVAFEIESNIGDENEDEDESEDKDESIN